MKHIIVLLINALALFSCATSKPNAWSQKSPNRYVGYVPIWEYDVEGFDDVFNAATHLNLSFFNADTEGRLTYDRRTAESDADLKEFIRNRQSHGTKVLFSIGGGLGDGNMYLIDLYRDVLKPENRKVFIDEIVMFIDEFGFDGIDVDLEHRCINRYYSDFIIDLKKALEPEGSLLTCAIAKYQGNLVSAEAYRAFDFINIMVYDYTGWGHKKPGDLGSTLHVQKELDYWTGKMKIPADKVVIGVPYYGYSWKMDSTGNLLEKGAHKYSWFVENYPEEIRYQDNFSVDNGDGTTTYYATNSYSTIFDKAALSRRYGGIMCWHLMNDVSSEKESMSLLVDKLFSF